MRKWIVAVLCLGAVLAGCNTISGIGQDVQAGGKAMERAADRTKEKL